MMSLRAFLPLLGWSILSCSGSSKSSQISDFAVVPRPQQTELHREHYTITAQTQLGYAADRPEFEAAANALNAIIKPLLGTSLQQTTAPESANQIRFCTDTTLGAEAYRLRIDPAQIIVAAADARGAFYAVQTLRQLLPTEPQAKRLKLPCGEITDAPRFAYRGLMLDVSRHFFTIEEVKRTLDLMAIHKLNTFHWHLTDDQGWRIEIKGYPQLTEIGSIRKRTLIGADPGGTYDESCQYDETPYGGFYTQEQIREVVRYAAQRQITVIPEIEFPGHAMAALASYPWLGCTQEQFEVRQTWDIEDHVFCIGRETTFEFIEQVLSEVIELFPSQYIHIGGDECPMQLWKSCPQCLARMKAEGYTDLRRLQNYATARIETFLQSHGRELIGWEEILEGEVSPTAIVMSWHGTEGGIRAAQQGNRVIMSPSTHCYFDYYQSQDKANEPLAWGGFLPVEQVYTLDPTAGLNPSEAAFVLGVQANLWSEYIPNYEQVQYMLLPRLAALAEVGWSSTERDLPDFKNRMQHLRRIYDALGYHYATHFF